MSERCPDCGRPGLDESHDGCFRAGSRNCLRYQVTRLRAQLAAAEGVIAAADELYDAANQGVLSYEHVSVYSSRRAALAEVMGEPPRR